MSLAPNATSVGSRKVTVPVGTPAGTYYLLACADDLLKIQEGNDTNNCSAAPTTVIITP